MMWSQCNLEHANFHERAAYQIQIALDNEIVVFQRFLFKKPLADISLPRPNPVYVHTVLTQNLRGAMYKHTSYVIFVPLWL